MSIHLTAIKCQTSSFFSDIQAQDYHYTDKLPDELECPLCLQIFSNPTLTSCGHHFCQVCIDRVIQQNKPCPICKELNFQVFLDKSLNRKVSLVRVHCSKKEKGCEWVGELKYLKSHVDGDCGFVQVACEYGYVGCTETILRKDMPKHMAENVAIHLLLVSKEFVIQQAEIRNKVADLSQQLVEKDDENRRIQQLFHEKEEEFANTKEHLQDQISDLHTKLESVLEQNETQISELQDELSQKDHQIRILEQSVQNLQLQCPWPPFQFTLENFSQHKRNKDVQYCPGFHTYPGGHKLCIAVYSNGHGEGTNTHVSLWLYCMRTSLDSQLKWPVKCTLKIELLNQEGDYQHHETTISASWGKPITDRFGVRPIESKFIPHSALVYNPTNSTQYLRDVCLHFRVTLM